MPTGAFAPLPLRLGGPAEEGMAPEQHARLAADVVAIKRTAPLASWTADPVTVGAITSYRGMTGVGLLYAPSYSLDSTGQLSFQWPRQTFTDEHDIEYPFRIKACRARADNGAGPCFCTWVPIARGVRIYTFDASGAAANRVLHISVW